MEKNTENQNLVTSFIENYELTNKAKFLYKNGFVGETFQKEKIDEFKDVTHKNGFKGFTVLLSADNKLYIAKPETDDEDSIFAYNLIEILNTSEEEYRKLRRISVEDGKGLFKVFRLTALIISFIGMALSVVYVIQSIITYGLAAGLIAVAPLLIYIATSVGILALAFRKK